MTAKHHPTPWKTRHTKRSIRIFETKTSFEVCSIELHQFTDNAMKEASAEFIVRAVNCHDDLVKVLNDLLGEVIAARIAAGLGPKSLNISAAKAALAKAKGETP